MGVLVSHYMFQMTKTKGVVFDQGSGMGADGSRMMAAPLLLAEAFKQWIWTFERCGWSPFPVVLPGSSEPRLLPACQENRSR